MINRDGERIPVASSIRAKQVSKVYDYYGAAGVIDKVDNYIFDERLLLIGEDGANLLSRAKDNAFFAEGKYWVNNHAHVLDATDKILLDYVALFINTIPLDDHITGSAQPKLSQDSLNNILLPIPPYREQNKIITTIRLYTEIIDSISSGKELISETLSKAKSKILELAVTGKLVPQNPDDEPAAELLKRINPKAEIITDNGHYPCSWAVTTLGAIGKWQSGATPSRLKREYYGGNIPWLKTGDLNDSLITSVSEYITDRALAETSVKLNPKGSILIAMYGATIGKVGILDIEATTNQACCACIDYIVEQKYLYYFLIANREKFVKMGGGGAQPNISKEKIISTIFPMPPIEEQRKIIKRIDSLFALIDSIKDALQA